VVLYAFITAISGLKYRVPVLPKVVEWRKYLHEILICFQKLGPFFHQTFSVRCMKIPSHFYPTWHPPGHEDKRLSDYGLGGVCDRLAHDADNRTGNANDNDGANLTRAFLVLPEGMAVLQRKMFIMLHHLFDKKRLMKVNGFWIKLCCDFFYFFEKNFLKKLRSGF